MKMIVRSPLVILAVLALAAVLNAQGGYSYDAQKELIPTDLGKVYLGMPLVEFAKAIELEGAEVDGRFDYLIIDTEFTRGNVEWLSIRVAGLSDEDKQRLIKKKTVTVKGEFSDYERTVEIFDSSGIGDSGFVYAMYVGFKSDFDLSDYVIRTYGKDGEVHRDGDEYHLFDIQWTRESSDGLNWLIRSFHESDKKSLQLLGRIPGTEWGLD